MRGSIVRRSKTSWALVIDRGRDVNGKRKQRWIAFTPDPTKTTTENKKAAEAKLRDTLGALHNRTFVDASKVTLVEFLRSWFGERVEPINRPSTLRVYKNIIERHIAKAPLGALPIQHVTVDAIETYYMNLKLSTASVAIHHALLCRAFDVAVKKKLVESSPMRKQRIERPTEDRDEDGNVGADDVREHVWTAEEARRFLAAAKADGPLAAAFFATALDVGCRKAELYGLTWDRVDLDARTVRIDRQLYYQFGTVQHAPLKTSKKRKNKPERTVTVAPETAALLRAHRAAQNALKMKNRTTYRDRGFVFAVEPRHQQTPKMVLGDPLITFGETAFPRIIKAAGVKRIKFHGLRHSCASLLLAAGVPVNNVSKRLGHSKPSITIDVYGHVLAGSQEAEATAIGAAIHG